MNEGKQKLQAMRKMLKKKGNNNQTQTKLTTNEANPTKDNIIINESKNRDPQNSELNKNHEQIHNSIHQNNPAVGNILIENQNSQKIESNINSLNSLKKPIIQAIRQEGEIEDNDNQEQINQQGVQNQKHPDSENVQDQKGLDNNPLIAKTTPLQSAQPQKQAQPQSLEKKNSENSSNSNQDQNKSQPVQSALNKSKPAEPSLRSSQQIENNLTLNAQKNQNFSNPLKNTNQSNHINEEPKNQVSNEEILENSYPLENQKTQKQPELQQLNDKEHKDISLANPQKKPNESRILDMESIDQGEAHSIDKTHLKTNISNPTQIQSNLSLHTPNQISSVQNQSKGSAPSSKPSIKVILKELDMIKSSIHNLHITYRGAEFLREQIKKDSILKKRIKERLQEFSNDSEYDVLRKLVKKAQLSEGQNSSNHEPQNYQKLKKLSTHQLAEKDCQSLQNPKQNINHSEVPISKESIQA